jgi:hypothetical protein
MANNRVSGRQAGQAAPPATSSSARVQPAARPSARLQPPGPAPTPSGRMQQQPSASGRMVASASGRSAAPAPASQSARARASVPSGRSARGGAAEQGGKPGKYKKRRGGPELIIAFGVISLLGISAAVLGVMRNKQKADVEGTIKTQQDIFDRNIKLASDSFERADQVGRLYVMGKEPNAVPDAKELDPAVKTKLFGSFQTDSNVYNVIYDWNYKDKKQKVKTRQEFLYPDRVRIEKMDHGKEENGVRFNYGFADGKTTPIIIASKSVKPQEGDQANTGGMITVIVKAEKDNVFEKAMNAKPKEPAAATPPAGEAGK